jgi:hypothetical protein
MAYKEINHCFRKVKVLTRGVSADQAAAALCI